eukprot:GFKZ01008030.1.p1 GENE.GFKZ01008030.1~~GFKZ01008030.1.p1  ORF type:complete len:349 (-),score=48.88 GFKZ01008030.1:86-1003(-)
MSLTLRDTPFDITPLAAAEALLLALEPSHPLTFTHGASVCSESALRHLPALGASLSPLTMRPALAVYNSKLHGTLPVTCGIEVLRVDKQDDRFWRARPDAREVAAEFQALFEDPGLGPRVARMVERAVVGALLTTGGVSVAVMPAGAICFRVEEGRGGEGVVVRVSRVFGGAAGMAAVVGVVRLGMGMRARVAEVRGMVMRIGRACAEEEGCVEGVGAVLRGVRKVVERGRGWVALRGEWKGRDVGVVAWDGADDGERAEFLARLAKVAARGAQVVGGQLLVTDAVAGGEWTVCLPEDDEDFARM